MARGACGVAAGRALGASAQAALVARGFAELRRFGRGWVIGPVVAPDADGAKALILHWLAVKQGSFCRIDIPGESGLGPWLEELGLPCVGTVLTMARGPADGSAVMVCVMGMLAIAPEMPGARSRSSSVAPFTARLVPGRTPGC